MTLTEVAFYARKIIAGILGAATIYLLIIILAPGAKGLVKTLFPPRNPPNVIYGQLPPLEFVEKAITNTQPLNFELNTKDGRLPAGFPASMVVYPTATPAFSYSAGKLAQQHAAILGFTDDELITDLKGDTYRWRDTETNAMLEIDINTKKLTLNTPLGDKKQYMVPGSVTESAALNWAFQSLRSIGRLYDTLYNEGTQTVTMGKIQGNGIIRSGSLDTELARVDFFRDINDYTVLGPDPAKGLINITVSRPKDASIVLNHSLINYSEWEIISTTGNQRATYPIIGVAEAWHAVSQENRGVITNITPVNSSIFNNYVPTRIDKVLINNIYLAYYDTPERQKYIQPIYVFEGSYNVGNSPGGNITLYYPAIPGQYVIPLETQEPTQETQQN